MKKQRPYGRLVALLTGISFLLLLPGSAGAESSATVQEKAPAAVPAAEASPTPPEELVEFDVGVNLKNQKGAEAFAEEVSDPTSRRYGRYLTPQAWEKRYSPTKRATNEVVRSLREAGFSVIEVSQDGMTVIAEGTVEQIEEYFSTQLVEYEVGDETLRLASSSLSAPSSVAPLISGVRGVNEIHVKPAALTGAEAAVTDGHGSPGHGHPRPKEEEEEAPIEQPEGFRVGTPCSSYFGQQYAQRLPDFGDGFPNPLPYAPCGYKPAQLQGAYNLTGSIAKGLDGSGVTVAIVDAYESPTLYSDAAEYAKRNQGQAGGRHGSQQWRPRQFKTLIQHPFTLTEECEAPGWSGEQTLDVEAVHAMAPGAQVLYVGGRNCTVALYNAVQEVVDGHLADIVTNSWSNGPEEEEAEPDEAKAAFENVLLMAAGTGVGVQFSSGDEGDNFIVTGEQKPSFPGTSPYATAIGGTSVEIGPRNERIGEVGWSTGISVLCTAEEAALAEPVCEPSEVGQWLPPAPGAYDYGGGGGTAADKPEPWYQQPVVPAELAMRAGTGHANRVVPDISMEGDPSTGMLVGETQKFADGTYYDEYRIGGTSLSSPLFAGLMADTDQAAGYSLGFVNPLLYHLESQNGGAGAFYDVVPAGHQAVIRNDYLNSENAEDGILTSARILDLEEATEFYCGEEDPATGECEEGKETSATESLTTAPGYDSMTGIGSPGDQFIRRLATH